MVTMETENDFSSDVNCHIVPSTFSPTPSTDNNGSDDTSRSQPSAELTENNKSEYEHNFNTFVKKSDFKQKKYILLLRIQWL